MISWDEQCLRIDWLPDSSGEDGIRGALSAAISAVPLADAETCVMALAAAELVAAAAGRPLPALPGSAASAAAAIGRSVAHELQPLAVHACSVIEAGSELQELFDEGSRDERWHSYVLELRDRLAAM